MNIDIIYTPVAGSKSDAINSLVNNADDDDDNDNDDDVDDQGVTVYRNIFS